MSFLIISSAYTGPALVLGSGSGVIVVHGGTVSNVTVLSGGDEIVDANGASFNDTISAGGFENVGGGGVATDPTVSSGGTEEVIGLTVSLTVASGGLAYVEEGGTARATTVNAGGGFEIISGTASATTISAGGFVLIDSGASASGVVIDSGGYLVVLPGGTAAGVTLAGGQAISTGVVVELPGGGISAYASIANGVVVGSGLTEYVLSGGTALDTTAEGGILIESGGIASNTSLLPGSYETVASGGTDFFASVGMSANLQIESAGLAVLPVASSGGYVTVGSGGGISSPSLISGGGLDFNNGGTIIAGVTLAGTANLIADYSYGSGTALSGATIAGFTSGDLIVTEADIRPGAVTSLNSTTYVLSISGVSSAVTYQLDASALHDTFTVSSFNEGEEIITAACFRRGTRILTDRGDIAVERLAVGDMVRTIAGECAPIRWIGWRAVECKRHPDPASVLPVRVAAHAFGENLPSRALFLSPDHAVFVEQVLVPIKYLLNGTSIRQVPASAVMYYHIELERHDVLLAENLPAETYLDTGDRRAFMTDNAVVALHPVFGAGGFAARIRDAMGYAPLMVAGPAVEAARAMIAARAGLALRSVV
jgi:autotransporter passenger strand-loop-strand repeat protein